MFASVPLFELFVGHRPDGCAIHELCFPMINIHRQEEYAQNIARQKDAIHLQSLGRRVLSE